MGASQSTSNCSNKPTNTGGNMDGFNSEKKMVNYILQKCTFSESCLKAFFKHGENHGDLKAKAEFKK